MEADNSNIDLTTLKRYFGGKEWAEMSAYEKNRFVNVLRNYEAMKKMGLDPKMPDFMVPKKKTAVASKKKRKSTNKGQVKEPAKKKIRKRKKLPKANEVTMDDEVKLDEGARQQMSVLQYLTTKRLEELTHLLKSFDCHTAFASEADSEKESTEEGPRGRYPKRNVPKVSYTEEDISSDDDYFYCDVCEREYDGCCPEHGPFIHVKDRKVTRRDPKRAWKTCPNFMSVGRSGIKHAGLGVWTEKDLPQGLVFGPYEGAIVKNRKEVEKSGYAWEIQRGRSPLHYVEGANPSNSNWLRFINCAPYEERQNVVAFQYDGNIFYRTYKAVDAYTELLVWYGDGFGIDLGILTCKKPPTAKDKVKSIEYDRKDSSPVTQDGAGSLQSLKSHVQKRRRTDPTSENGEGVKLFDCGKSRKENKIPPIDAKRDFLLSGDTGKQILNSKIKIKKYSVPGVKSVVDEEYAEMCGVTDESREKNAGKYTKSGTNKVRGVPVSENIKKSDENEDGAENRRVNDRKGGKVLYSCEQCDYKTVNKSHLKIHVDGVHNRMRPHECPECEYSATRAEDLKRHVDAVHAVKKPYKCVECEYRSAQAVNLRRHVDAVHKGKKPFQCTECDYRAAQAVTLRRHVDAVHEGKKPHKCPHCDYSASRLSHIKSHVSAQHEENKPYKCPHCEYASGYPSDLHKHTKAKHSEKL